MGFTPEEPIAPRGVASVAQEGEIALKTSGQRRINVIWEVTQATVALLVTTATLYVSTYKIIHDDKADGAFLLLSNVFFLVVGTYFQRTNHTRIGGIGGDTR